MIIDCNLVEFFEHTNNWLDVYYDNSYIQSIRESNNNRTFNIYCAVTNLLIMRNVDAVYLKNLHKQSNELEFYHLLDKLNKKLVLCRDI